MPLSTDDEIAIIGAAGQALDTLTSVKEALAAAKAALEPLQSANVDLTATVDRLTTEDARVDAAIEALKTKIPSETPAP